MTAAELLAGVRRHLIEIIHYVPTSRAAWDEARLLRLAVMKLWIDTGNYADSYSRAIGAGRGVEPWADLVGYRSILAHQLPEGLSEDRLWADAHEVSRLLAAVDAAL